MNLGSSVVLTKSYMPKYKARKTYTIGLIVLQDIISLFEGMGEWEDEEST